jgi:hypothetical protein
VAQRLKLALSPRARYLYAAAVAAANQSPRLSPRGYSCRARTMSNAKDLLVQLLQKNLHWDIEWVPDPCGNWPHTVRVCRFLFCANVLYLDYRNEYQASIHIDNVEMLRYIECSRPEFMSEIYVI